MSLCIRLTCRFTLTSLHGLFLPEHPVNADQQERTLLKGMFSVRKGKTQLHKWAERQVILCGTCLIVASVKDSLTGKMHILPLVGGKVRVQCLAGQTNWSRVNLSLYRGQSPSSRLSEDTLQQHSCAEGLERVIKMLYCTCRIVSSKEMHLSLLGFLGHRVYTVFSEENIAAVVKVYLELKLKWCCLS